MTTLAAHIRKIEQNPKLAVRVNGNTVEVFRQPKNCATQHAQWDYYGQVKDFPEGCPTRPLHVIAQDILNHWPNVYYGARPYLVAMNALTDIKSDYGMDSAESIVNYFLANAKTWRGEDARRIKAELKALLKS